VYLAQVCAILVKVGSILVDFTQIWVDLIRLAQSFLTWHKFDSCSKSVGAAPPGFPFRCYMSIS